MAKYTAAEVCERLLAVRAALAAGRSASEACKAAGLSPGTYKKWLTTWAALDLPSWVVAAPHRGVVALSGDGRHVFLVGDAPTGYSLARLDAATGVETARALHAAPRDPHAWRDVLAATADASGTRLRAIASGGAMFTWDVARGEVSPVAHDLRRGCVELTGAASSGARRWAYASVSPDLARVAYWETFGDRDGGSPARVVVRGIDDGEVACRHELPPQFIGSELVFHPSLPRLALLGENKLITVLDFAEGRALIEEGPQAHSTSFGPGETVFYDDWYAHTQSFDLATRESRMLRGGYGSIASQGDRYVNVTETGVVVRSLRDPEAERKIPLEKIVYARLSPDGATLAVVADRLCVWTFGR